MTPKRFLEGYSNEVTAKDADTLCRAADLLPLSTPVSITFLQGDRIDQLIAAAAAVRRAGFEPVPHIAARHLRTREELQRFVAGLRDEAAVTRVFVIAGDSPKPSGPYSESLELLKDGLLPRNGITTVGMAGYPEGHPAIDSHALARALDEKFRATAAFGMQAEIVTQFTFDADAMAAWVAEVRARGIFVPIRLGIAGPASMPSLLRFAARCGVGASAKVMAKYGLSITRLVGNATPDHLIRQLCARLAAADTGMVLAHLYPFGGVEITARWVRNLPA
jgi:methylenetetrahydrofolate reductase (NADPH)